MHLEAELGRVIRGQFSVSGIQISASTLWCWQYHNWSKLVQILTEWTQPNPDTWVHAPTRARWMQEVFLNLYTASPRRVGRTVSLLSCNYEWLLTVFSVHSNILSLNMKNQQIFTLIVEWYSLGQGTEKTAHSHNQQEHKDTVTNHLISKGIMWHFNLPSTPQYGGLGEVGVTSVKYHVKCTVGKFIFT